MPNALQDDLNRREFLRVSLGAAAALPVAGALLVAVTARAEGQMVTDIAAMKPTVEALQYVAQSTKPGETCKVCQFYTPAGTGTGKCQLFTQGLVSENGRCASWVKKVS